jgi:hypothetical protein
MGLKKYFFSILMIFLLAGMGFAFDFGLVIDQKAALEHNKDNEFEYSGTAIPWFSTPLGKKANLYISGSFTMDYENKEWSPIPELARAELILRPKNGIATEIGRVNFSDPLGIIATGLFDGAKASLGIKGTRLSLGAFYTGFLYNETANIAMTGADLKGKPDYSDFADTYFASRRVLGFLRWETPALSGFPVSFVADGLAQFDANGRDEALNSQYLTLRALFSPANGLNINLGAVLGLVEITDQDTFADFAASASVIWMLPTQLEDFASLGILWSSGAAGDKVGPFAPVTAIPQGKIFTPTLSGLMAARGGYTFSLKKAVAITAEASCFLRADLETQPEADPDSDSYLLGGEVTAAAKWAPVSDVHVTLEGGAFFPGPAMADDSIRARVSLELVLSF